MVNTYFAAKKDMASCLVPELNKLGIDQLLNQLRTIKKMLRPTVAQESGAVGIHNDPGIKVFMDPVHGPIELHPPCVEIIDTPQFQRLRSILQLGCGYFVYPGASHNRFEHSLGVCYLAGQLVTALQKRQPDLGIDDADVLCVEIAGLCHDLGHGPFSHVFEKLVIPRITEGRRWKHEDASVAMFDYILQDNTKVNESFDRNGLKDIDKQFIKELIGESNERTGRPPEKSFLYDIVSNKASGIDVDKWDYFARDCHMLGIKNNFDHNRLIRCARVIKANGGNRQICFRDKDVWNLYDMFHTRLTLHIRAYQHKTVRSIEAMLTDALVAAKDYLKFQGNDGQMKTMAQSLDSMAAFMQMTDDSVYNQILYSVSEAQDVQMARTILKQIKSRNIYKLVGQTQLKTQINTTHEQIKEDILSKMGSIARPNEADVLIDVVTLNYGKGTQNPIENVYFYTKSEPNQPVRITIEQVSRMLPEIFQEQYIRLYTKEADPELRELLKQAFFKWCKEKVYPVPIGM